VRDALLHLYDPGHLHGHALLRYAPIKQTETFGGGKGLRQAILDAIEGLRPGPGVPAASRAWRLYQILEFRYIEGLDIAAVTGQTALSRSQYHREHLRALQAVASVLWEQWGLGATWFGLRGQAEPPSEPAPSARGEARHLLQERTADRIDVADVALGVARLVEPLARRHGVALQLEFPTGLPDLRGDRVALRHALLTLLTPALHRGEGGALEVRGTASFRQITIDLLFPAQGGAPQAELTESRPFVEALGGRLTVLAPQPPAGSWRVRLQFPTDRRPALLVVDNNADFLRLIERYLAGQAWQMMAAIDADKALILATQRRPDAILLDVVIPGRDGWELLQDLKTAPETHAIPVVVCSVLYEPDVAVALGAAAYLKKPITQRQLLDWLGSFPTSIGTASSGGVAASPAPLR
jgi:CheY-like chemotaxis protein